MLLVNYTSCMTNEWKKHAQFNPVITHLYYLSWGHKEEICKEDSPENKKNVDAIIKQQVTLDIPVNLSQSF